MDWYNQWTQILALISEPLGSLYFAQDVPLFGAFILGVLGALAPCQISANVGIISYTTGRMTKAEKWLSEILAFFTGKTLVYFLLGLLVLMIGRGLEDAAVPVFQVARVVMGPLFLFTGLYFVGAIRFNIATEKLLRFQRFADHFSGNTRAFYLGVILSLAFCPTMFLLFFGLLMPLVLSTTGYGIALPFIFSIGTFIPVIIIIGLLFALGMDRSLIKKSKRIGKTVQIVAGIILILIGINDIVLYWFPLFF